jgi:hypothetical protein
MAADSKQRVGAGRLQRLQNFSDDYLPQGRWLRILGVLLACYAVVVIALGLFWSIAPEHFDVRENARRWTPLDQGEPVTGAVTTAALLGVVDTLLSKPGGYLANDMTPPGVYLDNVPNWEYGALVQSRDLARALRELFSRSQSQSKEDVDLAEAEPRLNFQHDSWLLPATETKYRESMRYTQGYLVRLADPGNPDAQFYARADNLREWLAMVNTRLGSLSQRLSASVGQRRVNTDLAGEQSATQATYAPSELEVRTPWNEDRRCLLRGARRRLGADPFPQGGGGRLRRYPAQQERRGQPAPDHPRAGGDAGDRVEPDDSQRYGVRHIRQPLPGDGVLHQPCQRGDHRPA